MIHPLDGAGIVEVGVFLPMNEKHIRKTSSNVWKSRFHQGFWVKISPKKKCLKPRPKTKFGEY